MQIPIERINVQAIRKELTYHYTPMGERVSLTAHGYYLDGDFLCVPRQYGLKLCSQLQIEVIDETSQGRAVHFPKVPQARAYQQGPLAEIEAAFDQYYDVTFRAHTGWGKTIGALITAAALGRSVLIIVDQENLRDQWVNVLIKIFGFRKSHIGIVQADTLDYETRAVTIAMVQTLSQRDFAPEFYQSFGMLIGDEVHTLGAPTFSKVLLQFPAAYRLFVSATPKRKDGLQRALEHNCGPVRVAADKQHDESSVYILRNDTVYSWYANISPKTGRIITEVSEDPHRNLRIAEAAIWLKESGRDTLILSDRIDHLKNLKCLMIYLGVPEEEIGLYTGYDIHWTFTKDPAPKQQPRDLHRWVNADGERVFAEYCAVGMVAKQKKVPKAKLEKIEKECSYILATYGKFAKGIDVPRLAGGVDATPRSTAEQVQGRILRYLKGKLKPIWVTMVDQCSYRLMYSFSGRIGEYLKSNACLYEWDGLEGVEEWNAQQLRALTNDEHARLQGMEIKPGADGFNHLQPKKKAAQEAAAAMRKRFIKPPSPR